MRKIYFFLKTGAASFFLMSAMTEAQAHHRPGFCARHPHTPHCTALRVIPPPPACYHHPHARPCRKHFRYYHGGNPYRYHHRHHHRHHH